MKTFNEVIERYSYLPEHNQERFILLCSLNEEKTDLKKDYLPKNEIYQLLDRFPREWDFEIRPDGSFGSWFNSYVRQILNFVMAHVWIDNKEALYSTLKSLLEKLAYPKQVNFSSFKIKNKVEKQKECKDRIELTDKIACEFFNLVVKEYNYPKEVSTLKYRL